jgi:hypothetical protein
MLSAPGDIGQRGPTAQKSGDPDRIRTCDPQIRNLSGMSKINGLYPVRLTKCLTFVG